MIPVLSPKQPAETVPGCYLNFRKRLLATEVITNATVTSSVPGMVEVGSVEWSGTVVSWSATGGVDGDNTIFTAIVTGSLGSVREGEVSMSVKAI